jgi:heme A synthase
MKLGTFQWFSLATAAPVYILIVLGGLVSSTGSGLACPDWPLCRAQILPTFTPAIAIEFTHRIWTLVVTVLVVATTVLAWRKFHWPNRVAQLSTLMFTLLLGQIILGMVTVDTRTLPAAVTSHLAVATLVFGSALATSIVSLTSKGRLAR